MGTIVAQVGGFTTEIIDPANWVGGVLPGNGDDIQLGNVNLTWSNDTGGLAPVFPASGTLGTVSASGSGNITINMDLLAGGNSFHATTLHAGTNTNGLIKIVGGAAGKTLSIDADGVGGKTVLQCAAVYQSYGIINAMSAGTLKIFADVQAGAASEARGIYQIGSSMEITGNLTAANANYASALCVNSSGQIIIHNSIITGGLAANTWNFGVDNLSGGNVQLDNCSLINQGQSAWGGKQPTVWAPGAGNFVTAGSTYLHPGAPQAAVKKTGTPFYGLGGVLVDGQYVPPAGGIITA